MASAAKQTIQEHVKSFGDAAKMTLRAHAFLQAIEVDPDWIWPINDACSEKCMIDFASSSGQWVCVEFCTDSFMFYKADKIDHHYSDVTEFCKALKAELRK